MTEAGSAVAAVELATDYMGLRLKNPLIASPSPLSYTLDGVRRLADGGVGAIVLFSLFEEQIEIEAARRARLVAESSEISAEARGYFPSVVARDDGPREYLELVQRAVATVDVPVIASLNGATPGGWLRYAQALQTAGAAAIELNVYQLPGDPFVAGDEFERSCVEIVAGVRAAVTVPVAVKLGPYFSSIGELAARLTAAGADGLVLFNRFLAPDIDPEQLAIVGRVNLSRPDEGRLARAWIALLHGRVDASLAASTGVETSADVAGFLLAGADVVMTTSALLRHGPAYGGELLDGLRKWMVDKGFARLDEVRGLLADPRDAGDGSARGRSGYAASMRGANAGIYTAWE